MNAARSKAEIALGRDTLMHAISEYRANTTVSLRDAIDAFGGGLAGQQGLAREIAREEGIKYDSAMRRIQRQITVRGGERRAAGAKSQRSLQRAAASKAGVRVTAHVTITVSGDGPRPRTIDDPNVRIDGDTMATILGLYESGQAGQEEAGVRFMDAMFDAYGIAADSVIWDGVQSIGMEL